MTCKKIDMDTYPRLGHFKHFLTMANPFLSVTVQVDLSEWLPRIKKSGLPFFLSFQYALVRAANRIPEFRQRIVGEAIVEYDYCDPSYTYGLPDGTYRYCSANTGQPLAQYLKEARGSEEEALREEHLTEHEDVLRYLFISCNPWFTYTSLAGYGSVQSELCLGRISGPQRALPSGRSDRRVGEDLTSCHSICEPRPCGRHKHRPVLLLS